MNLDRTRAVEAPLQNYIQRSSPSATNKNVDFLHKTLFSKAKEKRVEATASALLKHQKANSTNTSALVHHEVRQKQGA